MAGGVVAGEIIRGQEGEEIPSLLPVANPATIGRKKAQCFQVLNENFHRLNIGKKAEGL